LKALFFGRFSSENSELNHLVRFLRPLMPAGVSGFLLSSFSMSIVFHTKEVDNEGATAQAKSQVQALRGDILSGPKDAIAPALLREGRLPQGQQDGQSAALVRKGMQCGLLPWSGER